MSHSLFKSGFSTLLIKALGMPLAFALQLVLVRVMTVAEYGVYAFAVAWLSILTLVVPLGFDVSYMRFIPEYRVHAQWSYLKGILRRGNALVFVFSLIIAGICASLTELLVDDHSLRLTLLIMCFLLPIRGFNKLRQAALKSVSAPFWAYLPERGLRPVLLGAGCVILYWWGSEVPRHLTAPTVMSLNLVVMAVLLILGSTLLSKRLPDELAGKPSATRTREWLSVSFPLLIISGLSVVLIRTDVLMVGFLAGTEATGIYNAVNRAATLVTLIFSTVAVILGPRISAYYQSRQRVKLQQVLTRGAALSALSTLLILVPFCLFGRFVLGIFGAKYISGYPAFIILNLSHMVIAFASMSMLLFSVTVFQRVSAKILSVVVIFNIICNALLIPVLGIAGAATATLLARLLNAVLHLWYAGKYTDLDFTCVSWFKEKLAGKG